MRFLILAVSFLSIVSTTLPVSAGVGEGGMGECITLSLEAAVAEYSQVNKLYPLPKITIAKSDDSPSNGIDLMVTFNETTTYYIIATPISERNARGVPKLKGCSNARVVSQK